MTRQTDHFDEELMIEDSPRLLSRPLEALIFLIPLILFYEIGCILLQPATYGTPGQERVVAFHLLQVFFQLFGSTGVWMPGLAVIVILIATHIVSKHPWLVRRRAVGLMYIESAAAALPLLVFNHLLRASPAPSIPEGHVLTDAILGVGAGVYEELVFRLILISLIVMVGTDLLGLPKTITTAAAVLLSAIAFSAHHHPPLGSEPFSTTKFLFRAGAGLYLGVLFVFRGYGPAAGTHAAYNLMVTLLAR